MIRSFACVCFWYIKSRVSISDGLQEVFELISSHKFVNFYLHLTPLQDGDKLHDICICLFIPKDRPLNGCHKYPCFKCSI